jgi:hypothetical protein
VAQADREVLAGKCSTLPMEELDEWHGAGHRGRILVRRLRFRRSAGSQAFLSTYPSIATCSTRPLLERWLAGSVHSGRPVGR